MPPVEPPQVPEVEPGATVHGRPEQQSAVVVHAPPEGMHFAALHTKGGEPDGLGTHGRLQQSALDAHALPVNVAGSAVQSTSAARQRGMPRLSCLQVFFWSTLPAQQFAFALQDSDWRRQMAPAGLHLLPLSQRPIVAPAALEQVTFESGPSGSVAEPQQSLSSWQSSPVGWQPLGGWQMRTPVGA